jgi:hypothetical protein
MVNHFALSKHNWHMEIETYPIDYV